MNSLRRYALCALLLVLGIGVWAALRPAQGPTIPTWINYQGRLTLPNGNLVNEGTYNAVFRIFDAPTGGNELWVEGLPISVKQGVFSASLGKSTQFSPDLFRRPLWIETTIDGKVLAPRQELAAVPYAVVASSALSLPEGTLSSAMIQDGAVTSGKIAPGAVGYQSLGQLLHASQTARPTAELPQPGGTDFGDTVVLDLPGPGKVLVCASTTIRSSGVVSWVGTSVGAIQGAVRIDAPDHIYGGLEGDGNDRHGCVSTNCILSLPSGGPWRFVIRAHRSSSTAPVYIHTYALSAIYLGR